jgi:hypothetical protein
LIRISAWTPDLRQHYRSRLNHCPNHNSVLKRKLKILKNELGVVVHTFDPSTQKTDTRRSQVPDQPAIHSKTLSQNKKKAKNLKNE